MTSGLRLSNEKSSRSAIGPRQDPVLVRLRSALEDMYGNRIDHVVLFGSRARGDGKPDADYDVALFLKDLPDRWAERTRLADLRVRIIDETSMFVDILPFAAHSHAESSALMREIRQDGLIF